MKTSKLIILVLLFLSTNIYSQNRIHEWDVKKITSIKIEFLSLNNRLNTEVFDSDKEIETIIKYLKNIEFKKNITTNRDIIKQTNTWIYKIDFIGLRDQIYLFENSAFIGKTSFTIDTEVTKQFGNLLKELIKD